MKCDTDVVRMEDEMPKLLALITGFGLVAGARAFDFDYRVWFGRFGRCCQSI